MQKSQEKHTNYKMSLEAEVNKGLEHGCIDSDSAKVKKIERSVLMKGLALRFDDEQYQKALDVLSRYINKNLGNNKLRVGRIGYKILQEKGVKFNYI